MLLAPEQFERILRTLQGPPVTHEKRRVERFLIGTKLEFARGKRDDSTAPATPAPEDPHAWTWSCGLTHDISELGVGFVAGAPAQIGEPILVRIPDGGGGVMTVLCRVAHAEEVADGLYGIGLEFVQRVEDPIDAPAVPPPAQHAPLMPLAPAPAPGRPAAKPRRKNSKRGKLCCGGSRAAGGAASSPRR